jgi:hypothetical protein
VVSSRVLRPAASTSLVALRSMARATTPSSRVPSSSVARRLSPLSTSLPITRATSSPSSTPPRLRTRNLSTISGRGTSPSSSMARTTHGLTVRCSSRCFFSKGGFGSVMMRMIYDQEWTWAWMGRCVTNRIGSPLWINDLTNGPDIEAKNAKRYPRCLHKNVPWMLQCACLPHTLD